MSESSETEFEVAPFTVVVDSNESAPWQFRGLKGRARNGVRPALIVKTVQKPLWAWGRKEFGTGLADYSIDGCEEEIQIERKSVDDLFSTLSQRRNEFEKEIARLDRQCRFAAVVIEAGYPAIASFRAHGPDPASVVGTMVAWGQRYPRVHWMAAGSRDMAERLAFRVLERFWIDKAASAVTETVAGTTGESTEGTITNGSEEAAER